jgi:hypothetical protein
VSKYNAKRCIVDGHAFASKMEAARYAELKLLLGAKQIWGLVLQPRFALVVNGAKVGTYVADFGYTEPSPTGEAQRIIEDVKGVLTPTYRLKKKLFEALYPYRIREITKVRT